MGFMVAFFFAAPSTSFWRTSLSFSTVETARLMVPTSILRMASGPPALCDADRQPPSSKTHHSMVVDAPSSAG